MDAMDAWLKEASSSASLVEADVVGSSDSELMGRAVRGTQEGWFSWLPGPRLLDLDEAPRGVLDLERART